MAFNRRGDWFSENIEYVSFFRKFTDSFDVLLAYRRFFFILKQTLHTCSY